MAMSKEEANASVEDMGKFMDFKEKELKERNISTTQLYLDAEESLDKLKKTINEL